MKVDAPNSSDPATLESCLCSDVGLDPHLTLVTPLDVLCNIAHAKASFSFFKLTPSTANATLVKLAQVSCRISSPWYFIASFDLSADSILKFDPKALSSASETPVPTTAHLGAVHQVLTKCNSYK